jgi:hypothetical protein
VMLNIQKTYTRRITCQVKEAVHDPCPIEKHLRITLMLSLGKIRKKRSQ